MRLFAEVSAILFLYSTVAMAQSTPTVRTEVVHRTPGDLIGNSYRVYLPAALPIGRARGLLVLLSGYPSNVDSYQPLGNDLPSTLPARLAARGLATVVAVSKPETLYADEASLLGLDSIVADARIRYAESGAPVAVGGFSAGGTGALRFAERCAARACGGNPPVAAVFAVDSPLDFVRLWRATELALQRGSPRANAAEGRTILSYLRRTLGGPPDSAVTAYREASPLLASDVHGGNARLLRETPLRAYTEPDVQWWLNNRSLDYTGMNATDLAALVNVLRIDGNDRATLVTTVGRGMRPDGRRHPHSWAIVDETDLAAWLVGLLSPAPNEAVEKPRLESWRAVHPRLRRCDVSGAAVYERSSSGEAGHRVYPNQNRRIVAPDALLRVPIVSELLDVVHEAVELPLPVDL